MKVSSAHIEALSVSPMPLLMKTDLRGVIFIVEES